MDTVSLREVTPDNYETIVDMQVRPDQQNFVADTVHSLAEFESLSLTVPYGDLCCRGAGGFLNV